VADQATAAHFWPARLVARTQVAVQLPSGTQLRVPTSDPDVLQHVIEMLAQADAQRAAGLPC
jgi:uncharacterized protein YajQ (UPF0234 family)